MVQQFSLNTIAKIEKATITEIDKFHKQWLKEGSWELGSIDEFWKKYTDDFTSNVFERVCITLYSFCDWCDCETEGTEDYEYWMQLENIVRKKFFSIAPRVLSFRTESQNVEDIIKLTESLTNEEIVLLINKLSTRI